MLSTCVLLVDRTVPSNCPTRRERVHFNLYPRAQRELNARSIDIWNTITSQTQKEHRGIASTISDVNQMLCILWAGSQYLSHVIHHPQSSQRAPKEHISFQSPPAVSSSVAVAVGREEREGGGGAFASGRGPCVLLEAMTRARPCGADRVRMVLV